MKNLHALGISLLLVVGLLQPLGYILQLPALRGIGLAFVASPLPLVFSHFRGLETFSSEFTVSVTDAAGAIHEQALTPHAYARIKGPYNRRNVYGAVAAYGPKLTEPKEQALVASVLQYAFCKGPLLEALELDGPITGGRIHVINRYSGEPLDATLEATCKL